MLFVGNENKDKREKIGYRQSTGPVIEPQQPFPNSAGRRFMRNGSDNSPHMHHAQAARARGARTHIIRTKHETSAAMFSGATQYPRTHKAWKNDLRIRLSLVQVERMTRH